MRHDVWRHSALLFSVNVYFLLTSWGKAGRLVQLLSWEFWRAFILPRSAVFITQQSSENMKSDMAFSNVHNPGENYNLHIEEIRAEDGKRGSERGRTVITVEATDPECPSQR